MKTLTGQLHLLYETGMESTFWAFFDDHNKGYDALHLLKNNDHLIVYNADKSQILFEGLINLDYESNKEAVIFNPQYFWQRIDDTTVSGVQKDYDTHSWMQLFLQELPAKITLGEFHD